MDSLSSKATKVLNNITNVHDQEVSLGNIINEVIESVPERGTPVNAVAASETLTILGVVKHGETVTFDNPGVENTDVYEFLADEAHTKTDPNNVAVDISASTTKATGTLTMDTQPIAGDTVVIGEKTYIFVPVGTDTADGEVSVGADLAGAQAALVAAINGTDEFNTAHPLVSAADFSSDDCIITALIGGTAGNAITTTETFTAATNVFAAGTLGTGTDCSAANAIVALVAAMTAEDTQSVSAADGAGDTVSLTCKVAGEIGNFIAIETTMANGSFTEGAEVLSGGVNGTVGDRGKLLMDDSYLYVCRQTNTTSGKNWRRISLGNVF